MVAACRLDQLVRPPGPPRLMVSPGALTDSGTVGGAPVTRTVAIDAERADTARWTAVSTGRSGWLSLQQSATSVPATLTLALSTSALAPGVYRDTVVIAARGWEGWEVRLPVLFTVRESPVQLVFTTQPTDTRSGSPITAAVQVTARDQTGKTITSFSGDAIMTINNNPVAGTLSGTTTVAFSNGVARFSNLRIDRAGQGYTLRVTGNNVTSTSAAFTVTPRLLSATRSSVTTSAGTIPASDGSVPAALTVVARDEDGELMPGVSVALSASGSNNRLIPATGVTDSLGVFRTTFSSTRAELKAIYAAAAGTTIQSPASVRVVAGAAAVAVFTTQPSPARPNQVISPAITVTTRDAWGNTAEGFAENVTITIANDGSPARNAKLNGDQTVKASAGVANFNDLRIDRTGTGYTLNAKPAGLPQVTSSPFNVSIL